MQLANNQQVEEAASSSSLHFLFFVFSTSLDKRLLPETEKNKLLQPGDGLLCVKKKDLSSFFLLLFQ